MELLRGGFSFSFIYYCSDDISHNTCNTIGIIKIQNFFVEPDQK